MKRMFLITGGVLWFATIGIGMHLLFLYSTTPQDQAGPQRIWPSDTHIVRTPDRPTLLMFVHPKCPCTRASLGELDLLMTQCRDRVTTYVIFVEPSDASSDWTKTDLFAIANRISGVQVVRDEGGIEAARFHASTSGQTSLYDAGGKLLFRGGITSGRGHSGDNDGRTALASLLRGGTADRAATPVFGCSLYNCNDGCNRGGS